MLRTHILSDTCQSFVKTALLKNVKCCLSYVLYVSESSCHVDSGSQFRFCS